MDSWGVHIYGDMVKWYHGELAPLNSRFNSGYLHWFCKVEEKPPAPIVKRLSRHSDKVEFSVGVFFINEKYVIIAR